MIWQTSQRQFQLGAHALIMGVLNVTPDSFSDGGAFLDVDAATAHGRAMIDAGAAIIDIGGESTRPGAVPVPAAEELRRVLPVVERLAGYGGAALSIDTRKPEVARAAIAAGAEIINDVSGFRDAAMRDALRATNAAAIVMHMQGDPRNMQRAPHYDDVRGEIREFFRQAFEACLRCGIDTMRLAFDPGIGFGKTVAHNLELLRGFASLRVADRPLVAGVSRKSFIGKVIGSDAMADRAWPTVALTSYLRIRGADVIRVHEVRPNRDALRMSEAILRSGEDRPLLASTP
jgi:dihydropteroate synthase